MNVYEIKNEKETRLESNKDKIDPMLLGHPKFQELFENACENLFASLGSKSYQLEILDDGKTVRVFDDIGTNKQYSQEPNKHYNSTIIKLMDGNWISSELSSGTAVKDKTPGANDNQHRLDTYYKYHAFNENGIEMARSEFMDHITWDHDIEEIGGKVNFYKPNFNYISIQCPRFCNNASYKHLYRGSENLGLLTCIESENIKINQSSYNSNFDIKLYEALTEYPEYLRTLNNPIAIFDKDKSEFAVNASIYPTQTLDEVKEIVKENFRNGLETSKTKINNPQMYESLVAATDNHLKR